MNPLYTPHLAATIPGQTWSFDGVPSSPNAGHPRPQGWRELREGMHAPIPARSSAPGPPSSRQIPHSETASQPIPSESAEIRIIQNNGVGNLRPSVVDRARPDNSAVRQRPMVNPFGTREEIESEDYQSPLAQMFGRAWNRYREAQERISTERALHLEQRRAADAAFFGTGPPVAAAIDMEQALALERFTAAQQRLEQLGFSSAEEVETPAPQENPIDRQQRPPPLSSEDMTFTIACRICTEQRVDTLLEPCMHVAICRWCADITREEARQRRQQQRRRQREIDHRWLCPMCRAPVSAAKRIYLV